MNDFYAMCLQQQIQSRISLLARLDQWQMQWHLYRNSACVLPAIRGSRKCFFSEENKKKLARWSAEVLVWVFLSPSITSSIRTDRQASHRNHQHLTHSTLYNRNCVTVAVFTTARKKNPPYTNTRMTVITSHVVILNADRRNKWICFSLPNIESHSNWCAL